MTAPTSEQSRIDAQHARGRLTARERLDILFDEASFIECGPPGEGVVTGSGTINGRPAYAFSQDVTDDGGIITQRHAEKIAALIDRAIVAPAPILGLYDTPGTALDEGLAALAAQTAMMQRQAIASGVMPQLALLFEPTVGTAALSPALADFVLMLEPSAALYLAGPDVVRAATGEIVSADALGGAALHGAQSGIADGVFTDELELLFAARDLVDLLPSSHAKAPSERSTPDQWDRANHALETLVPLDPDAPYDMRELLRAVADERMVFDIQPDHAGNILCAFARVEGRALGIVASQPLVLSGVLDGPATRKATRFVRSCTRFGMPIVTIVDSPGFLPGSAEEAGGIVAHAAALLGAYAQATVPRITLVTRRALGGAWAVLAPKSLGTGACYAWPGAEIAAMRGQSAADLLFADAEHEKKRDYAARIADPCHAVAASVVDAVIRPAETRRTIALALRQATCGRSSGSMLPKPSPSGAGI